MKYRNCQVGDVVLVLDKEGPKGKFALGVIDSVKVDSDDVIRKVTVKYKLSQGGDDTNLIPMQYKYATRSVKGLALLITKQERENIQRDGNVEIDTVRSQEMSCSDQSSDANSDDDDSNKNSNSKATFNDANDDESHEENEERTSNLKKIEESRVLQPTSSGRRRYKPSRLDL